MGKSVHLWISGFHSWVKERKGTETADAAPNSKVPVVAPLVPGPHSGGGARGGPTWLAAAEQAWPGRAATLAPRRHRELRVPLGRAHGPRHARLRAPAPLYGHPAGRPSLAQQGLPPSCPSAARPDRLPASFPPPTLPPPTGGRAPSGPSPAQRPGAERFAPHGYLLPGRAHREASGASAPELGARSPGAGSGGKREGGRGSGGGGRGAGGLGAPCGWEDGTQNPSWKGDVREGCRRVLLLRSGPGWGGERIAVCDLVVT